MRYAVLDELRTRDGVPEALVEGPEVALRIEDGVDRFELLESGPDELGRQTLTPSIDTGDDPADTGANRVGQDTNGRSHPLGVVHPQMPCGVEEVSPVQLGVGAVLLDDEDVDTQAKEVMQLRRCQQRPDDGKDLGATAGLGWLEVAHGVMLLGWPAGVGVGSGHGSSPRCKSH